MNQEEMKKRKELRPITTLITKACKDGSKDDTDAELKRARRNAIIFTMYNKLSNLNLNWGET